MTKNDILKQHTTIMCKRIKLRPFHLEDAEGVYSYASDKKTVEFLTFPIHQDISQSEKVIKEFFLGKEGVYAIELISEKKLIGCIDLRLQEEHNKASFGYVINRNYWGQGYATEALNAILGLCFKTLKLGRVESTHYIGNEGSGRVMQKCGMKLEGIGLEELVIKGVTYDVAHYAVLRKYWTF